MNLDEKITKFLSPIGADLEHYKNVMDIFPMGLVVLSVDFKFIFYNQIQAKMDGLNKNEVLGRPARDIWRPLVGHHLVPQCQESRQPILSYPFQYETYNGRRVNCNGWIFPLFNNGQVSGTITFTQPPFGQSAKVPIQLPETPSTEGTVIKNIVGQSSTFRKAMLMAKTNATNPYPILIAGETGSGKELMAKLIHESSPRSKKPFMAINCSAIPDSLLEGLLFGTTKGSFTGSIDRSGLLEEANGGTLYLDEIDSMPLDLQPKLLRAIQEMQISRLGSTREIKLDLKVISSVGSHSYKALSSGKLRSDLFYRLAVAVINVPPLRSRLDDLQMLTNHFIQKHYHSIKQKKKNIHIHPELWQMMCNYHWPGNVRELQHMILGSLVMLQQGDTIELCHVPEHYLQAFHNGRSPGSENYRSHIIEPEHRPLNLQSPLPRRTMAEDQIERLQNENKMLADILNATGGNVSKAAKILEISRQALSYRLLKFGLNPKDFKLK